MAKQGKWTRLGLVFFLMLFLGVIQSQDLSQHIIYQDEQHNAFTSLIKVKGNYYCAFRSGERHVYGRDGTIRIITSEDLKQWKVHAVLAKDGFDLRDPKLSITPDGRIMALMGGSIYKGKQLLSQKTHVSFSSVDGGAFSDPEPIELDTALESNFDWLWRITWHQGMAYGVLYQREQKSTKLVKSRNGVAYQLVCDLGIFGRPNEATIRFNDQNEMFIMHRREEEDQMGYWGHSSAPYTEWDWRPMSHRLGGPDFVFWSEEIIIAGSRMYYEDRQAVGLLRGDEGGNFELIHEFVSDGDCSYPSFIVEPDRILMSYYASDQGHANIYLAEIPRSFIQR